jgi:cyanate permease
VGTPSSHFWLVLSTAIVSVALAYVTSVVAGRQRDARLVLISLAFFSAAGFLGLHALATPGVLLAGRTRASCSRRRSGCSSPRSSRRAR